MYGSWSLLGTGTGTGAAIGSRSRADSRSELTKLRAVWKEQTEIETFPLLQNNAADQHAVAPDVIEKGLSRVATDRASATMESEDLVDGEGWISDDSSFYGMVASRVWRAQDG